jgi:hypothetical protein
MGKQWQALHFPAVRDGRRTGKDEQEKGGLPTVLQMAHAVCHYGNQARQKCNAGIAHLNKPDTGCLRSAEQM